MLDKMELQLFADDGEEEQEDVEEASAEQDEKTEKEDNTQQKEDNSEKTIPYWRFKEVVEEKNKLSKQLNELQDKIENMDDPEKIKEEMEQENQKLQQRNKEFLKESELKVRAIAEGVRKEALQDFVKVADTEKLEVDENDNVTGVEELIEDAKENKSFYFGSEDGSSTKTAGDFNNDTSTSNEDADEKWLDKMMNLSQKY